MPRSVPVWVLSLVVLTALCGAVLFGWAVKSAMTGSRSPIAKIAYVVASFPDIVGTAFEELSAHLSGDHYDRAFRVTNDPPPSLAGFAPVPTVGDIALKGLHVRGDATSLVRGWRALSGVFHLEGRPRNAILLLSPELEVVHAWPLTEPRIDDRTPAPDNAKIVHGFDLTPDGSVVFSYNGSVSLQRLSACGERLWGAAGWYHHAVTADEDGRSVWTFNTLANIARVAIEDGEVLQEITTDAIVAANPDLRVLELRRFLGNKPNRNLRDTPGRWLADPLHYNDVEPLPAALAPAFPGFETGDLLVSARSLDLVFVLDPDTLKIRWHHIGRLRRQHDPDWLPTGRISVYNNRMGLSHSEIVLLDPASDEAEVALDGRGMDFYSRIRGKHQWLPDGGLVVASSQQGRIIETDADGRVVLEMLNLKPGSDEAYVVTEMKWLPPEFLNMEDFACDGSSARR